MLKGVEPGTALKEGTVTAPDSLDNPPAMGGSNVLDLSLRCGGAAGELDGVVSCCFIVAVRFCNLFVPKLNA